MEIVFPAGAGMNRQKHRRQARTGGVPRRRGDEPKLQEPDPVERVCSPQARG